MSSFSPENALSEKTRTVEEAAIIKMAQRAREMKAKGIDVASLTIGEPDFDTPQHIAEAATKAIKDGFTHYAPIPGFMNLREALADKLKKENNIDYLPEEIVLSNGAKQSLTNVFFALLDPGDEVILLSPFWVAYRGIIEMAGGVPVVLSASSDENFKVPASRIAAAMTERTKAVLINSPSNPTGAIMNREELQAIADVIQAHPKAMVVSDEIYEYIVFDSPHISMASLPGMKERTITINGFSKGFAMTGWRVGYGAAPLPVAKAMSKIQGTFTAGGNAFAQQASLAALQGNREEVHTMCRAYNERRDLIVSRLQQIPDVVVASPPGTFYIFPDVSAYLGKSVDGENMSDVTTLCNWLLEKHHVATVPGASFGDDKCLRMSFATSREEINKGLDRLEAAFKLLRT